MIDSEYFLLMLYTKTNTKRYEFKILLLYIRNISSLLFLIVYMHIEKLKLNLILLMSILDLEI